MTMRTGLAKSKNMVSIRLLQAVGPKNGQEWVSRFGFDAAKHPAYLTMALGAGSVTPMQLAVGYSVFANGGYRVNPYLIARVTDHKGRIISETPAPVLSESQRENYLQDGTYQNNSNRMSSRENYQGNVRLEMEWKPDSMNSVIIQPNMGFNRSFSRSTSDYLYLKENDTTSWGNTVNRGDGLDRDAGITLIYNRKLAKPGRTFTTRFNTGISLGDDNGMNYSKKNSQDSVILIDQRSDNTSNNFNIIF